MGGTGFENLSVEELEAELKRHERIALEYLQMYKQYQHFEDREVLRDQIVQCEQIVFAIKQEIANRT